jgi:hypothetical protein
MCLPCLGYEGDVLYQTFLLYLSYSADGRSICSATQWSTNIVLSAALMGTSECRHWMTSPLMFISYHIYLLLQME